MAEDNIDIEGDFSLDSNALSESSAILQDEFKPLWTSPDVRISTDSQPNEIERILADDTTTSFATSFLDSPSPRRWSRDEEDELARLIRENGEQWTKIGRKLSRTPTEVKAHARTLLLTDESFESPMPSKQTENKRSSDLRPLQANTGRRAATLKSTEVHRSAERRDAGGGFMRLDARGRRVARGNSVAALKFDEEVPPSSTRRPAKKALLDAGEVVTLTKDSDASDEEIRISDDEPPVESSGTTGSSRLEADPTTSKAGKRSGNSQSERLVPVNVKSFRKKRTSSPVQVPSSSNNTGIDGGPSTELHLDPYRILPFEEEANAEYFSGRSGQKTPERYLRIRNHIIALWLKQRPRYLNKTSSRVGLKNCGDVNCIGLIHDNLERVGAINFGCTQTTARKERSIAEPPAMTKVPRPRRKLKNNQSFVSQADIERGGCTMEHDSVTGEVISTTLVKPHENIVGSEKPPTTSRQPQSTNPFKLIHCLKYDADCQPFSVELSTSALLVAECHSHQSWSEIIGLLGGIAQDGVVRVMAAIPTRTTGTSGTECDMDPVSQCEAAETLRQWGLDVVGWYHSHPTFAPQPSMRDLTLQVDLQDMFNNSAGQPFVALIFSPYYQPDKPVNRLHTRMTCFVVEKHPQSAEYCPFSLKPKLVRGDESGLGPPSDVLLETIRCLREQAQGELVPLNESFNSEWTNLDKMMATLQLGLLKAKFSQDETTSLLNQIHSMFVTV